jgi:tripartite-type tricarboxylate transporter receptor subunit TctC
MVRVAYKRVTQAMVAMTGGEVDEVIMPLSTALTQIRTGKVRALAVLSVQRVPALPGVQMTREAGADNFTMPLWYGMFAPAGTPRDIVARLGRELIRALGEPDLRERLAALTVEPWPGTSEQMADLLRTKSARYAAVVRSAGLRRE